MRKILLGATFMLSLSFSVMAQTSDNRNGITYKLLAHDHRSPITGDYFKADNFTYGAEIGYFRYLNKSFNFGLPLRLSVLDVPMSDSLALPAHENKFGLGLDAVGVYKFANDYILKENACVAPYLFAGAGGRYTDIKDSNWDFQVPVGLGINFRLTEGFYLQAQSEYRMSFIQKRNSLVHSLGFLFVFGGGAKDTDGDGITDKEDLCPTVAGKAEFKGCPDTDGDGIEDSKDNCPTAAGKAEFKGCPDTDGDGITDKEDLCPKVAGKKEFKGCPDTDGDGIEDSKDNCPNEKGLEKFQGCPDTDGDGFADKDDKCPKEKGIAPDGCPVRDRDGDGVNDDKDQCPDVAGLAKLNGCPDTDGDGIADKDDRCPKEFGVAANKGCPEIKKEDQNVLIEAMGSVQFETGKATLKKESPANLDKVVAILNKYPNYSCSIEGHTDSVGDEAANQTLSANRAKTCYEYLVSKGISPSRLAYAGYGESRPVADNKTAEGRAQNRRTEFNLSVK